jgi:hypothetical protein
MLQCKVDRVGWDCQFFLQKPNELCQLRRFHDQPRYQFIDIQRLEKKPEKVVRDSTEFREGILARMRFSPNLLGNSTELLPSNR